MRLFAATIALFIMGCAHTASDQPRTQTPARGESNQAEHGQAEEELRRNIHIWRNAILPRAKSAKVNSTFDGDGNIKPLYTSAASAINVYIDTYTAELDSPSLSADTLNEIAVKTDQSVADFVRYVDRKNSNAAVNWVVLAPVIKDISSAIYEKYRDWKDNDRKAAEAALKTFKDSLQKLKVEESYDKV